MARQLLAACCTLLLAACGGAPRDPGAPDAGSPNPAASQGVGLHYDGAVAIKRASAASTTGWEQVEVSAFTVKPYWIPQLVDDVDVCAVTLGAAWRLITEADLATLDAADLKNIQDTLSGVGTTFWGEFYFSLHTYVRAADGKLAAGDLSPGATMRVAPLSYQQGGGPTMHYEGGLAPRCIWRHPVAG
jgi:hypothetical protein